MAHSLQTNSGEQVLSSWRVWLLALRPKTLPAAAAGVVTGTALALHDGVFRPLPALATLIAALLLQIGSNLANDVYDYERGADAGERLGPIRVTQAGLLTPAQVKTGMVVVFALAAILGLYLASVAGWVLIGIGAAAILAAILYTAGPFPMGYYGLGDLFVFIFFGLAAVVGTYYVQAGSASPQAWWMALPIGWLIVDILVVNNLRDIPTDRAAGKRTLAVRLGERGTRIEYAALMAGSYLLLPVLAIRGVLPWTVMLAWLSSPVAGSALRTVLRQRGRPLNAALARTAQTALLYSLLFLVGMMLA